MAEIRIRDVEPDVMKIAELIAKKYGKESRYSSGTVASGIENFIKQYPALVKEMERVTIENHRLKLQVQEIDNKKRLLRTVAEDMIGELEKETRELKVILKRIGTK
jgi:hypothetical protein